MAGEKGGGVHAAAAGNLKLGNPQRAAAAGNGNAAGVGLDNAAGAAAAVCRLRTPDFQRLALVFDPRRRHRIEGADFAQQ